MCYSDIQTNNCHESGHLLAFYFMLYTCNYKKEPSLPSQNQFQDSRSGYCLHLSQQQYRCLSYLYQGKSAKEIAKAMNLSYRTVQHYIDEIRRKNNYRSIKQLLSRVNSPSSID